MGRRTSTTTPDGGKVDYGYDADGQQISKVTPNLRATGQQITYRVPAAPADQDRLPRTPRDDVTYTYGGMGAPGNGAGQVVTTEDGSRIQSEQLRRRRQRGQPDRRR